MVREIKIADIDDLKSVLGLYEMLINDEDFSDEDSYKATWQDIISDKKITCFIIHEDGVAVATCLISIIPNLTRGQRPYGVIENVVTHSDYRNKGHGKAVIDAAISLAESKNCYKVMLLSASKRTEAHEFYKKIGFDGDSKKGFQKRFI